MMVIPPEEIAFDFDGVVADTFRGFIDIAKSRYEINIDYEDVTQYQIENALNIDPEIVAEIIEILSNHPHEIDLPPNQGAIDVLEMISSISSPLFVTARPYSAPVKLWFKRHFPDRFSENIEIVATGENTEKLPVLKDRGINYFIDDRIDTCFLLLKEGITPIVYDQPWNREEHPFHVVRNWEDISRLIQW
ncbi:MAG: hypothetical protein U9P49_08110 [Thermodesulfobacteriota bacterium]|nr:hypothetical protein [Thermodesulfobacteriota bacterium]